MKTGPFQSSQNATRVKTRPINLNLPYRDDAQTRLVNLAGRVVLNPTLCELNWLPGKPSSVATLEQHCAGLAVCSMEPTVRESLWLYKI